MTTSSDTDPAVSVAFVVRIDDDSLGAFNTCQGLGCEVVVEKRQEGGQNGFVHVLPTRITYSTIKLSRPLTADTAKVAEWVSASVRQPRRHTATIVAMRTDGSEVARWSLTDVLPVRWTGPSLDPDSPKVATETLEIAHHGFLESLS